MPGEARRILKMLLSKQLEAAENKAIIINEVNSNKRKPTSEI